MRTLHRHSKHDIDNETTPTSVLVDPSLTMSRRSVAKSRYNIDGQTDAGAMTQRTWMLAPVPRVTP